MKDQIKKRLLRTLIIILISLSIGGLLALQEVANRPAAKAQPVAGVKVGGPFTLINQNGESVTEQTYKGQYKLIYFGFTYCPAICPTELQKMTKALNILGSGGKQIQPLFITVDPERDTQKVLKDYVGLFSPRLVGLTGPKEEMSKTLKEFRIYAAKVQDPDVNEYTMDHSSFIYFMDGDDNLLGLYRSEDNADFMATDIKQKLAAAPHK